MGAVVVCLAYQDAGAFLLTAARRDPRSAPLRPGTYRSNTAVFKVSAEPITGSTQRRIRPTTD